MNGLQMPLQSIPDFQQEMRDRRYTYSVVAINALVTLRRLSAQGEAVSNRAWNEAWALAEKAVPPPQEKPMPLNASVYVHGPQGCGKTTHAQTLARHFGLNKVIDDWSSRDPAPTHDTLILSHTAPPESFPFNRALTFDQAMRLVKHAA